MERRAWVRRQSESNTNALLFVNCAHGLKCWCVGSGTPDEQVGRCVQTCVVRELCSRTQMPVRRERRAWVRRQSESNTNALLFVNCAHGLKCRCVGSGTPDEQVGRCVQTCVVREPNSNADASGAGRPTNRRATTPRPCCSWLRSRTQRPATSRAELPTRKWNNRLLRIAPRIHFGLPPNLQIELWLSDLQAQLRPLRFVQPS